MVGPSVYAGGFFTNAGDDPNADHIARWDTSTSTWNALGTGLNNDVYAIAVVGSDVYAGGDLYRLLEGYGTANNIARFNGTSWNSVGGGINGPVLAITVVGSDIYVGGNFTDAGGIGSADCIARWDMLTLTWKALGSGLNNVVNAIAVSGTTVYVGGAFTDAGGILTADYGARWFTSGSYWMQLGNELNSTVYSIAVEGPDVYFGGWFTDGGGLPRPITSSVRTVPPGLPLVMA